ncbi:MAG: HAD family hydrolase [Leptospirales bacterium]
MNKYKAVLFDLDGTLLNTIPDVATASNAALEQSNFPTHSIRTYEKMVGHGLRDLISKALPENLTTDNATIDHVVQNMLLHYENCYAAQTKPYPGILDMLQELTEKSVRLAVLSNKNDYFTKKIIYHIFKEYKFEIVLGARDNVPKKPNPAAAFEIIESMNLKSEDYLYMGDSPTDMKTALACNMFPVGVSWGYRPAQEIEKAGARVMLNHPLELLSLI